MPINIEWEDTGAEIKILCDACDKNYTILCDDPEGLSQCPFCGNYLDGVPEEGIDQDESEKSSWD